MVNCEALAVRWSFAFLFTVTPPAACFAQSGCSARRGRLSQRLRSKACPLFCSDELHGFTRATAFLGSNQSRHATQVSIRKTEHGIHPDVNDIA
jgi:hypothetical protein